MHRFFVPPHTLATTRVQIRDEVAHQIIRVLRMQAGDAICLLDGQGYEYRAKILSLGKDEVICQMEERTLCLSEPHHKVTLYLSLLNKADKFEWALQKCTEIGAAAFVPVRAARSIADVPASAKLERWRRIIQEAAEQSGRSIVPALEKPLTFEEVLASQAGQLATIPALGFTITLKNALRNTAREQQSGISIFIGPEGGFTPGEVDEAKAAGIVPVTLGPRTLRAETAAVAALTMTLYELGDMGIKG